MTTATDPLPLTPVSWRRVALAMVLAFAAAHAVDAIAWEHLRDPRVNDKDWGRWLRTAGYLPAWMLGALALWQVGRPPAGAPANGLGWRAGALVLAAALAGALAEVVKILSRRQRPGAESADYLFRPYDVDFLSTKGLGLVSSHAAVAFGAAAIMARIFPASRGVWYALAAGCALTRVLSGAHYLSDVVGAAILAWLVAEWVWRWASRRARLAVNGPTS